MSNEYHFDKVAHKVINNKDHEKDIAMEHMEKIHWTKKLPLSLMTGDNFSKITSRRQHRGKKYDVPDYRLYDDMRNIINLFFQIYNATLFVVVQ